MSLSEHHLRQLADQIANEMRDEDRMIMAIVARLNGFLRAKADFRSTFGHLLREQPKRDPLTDDIENFARRYANAR